MIDTKELNKILGELAGAASLCWQPRPTGVFHPGEAKVFVDEAISAIQNYCTEGRIKLLDSLIDIEPDKPFGHWNQKDIAHWYGQVGKIRRELEATLKASLGGDK